MRTKIEATKAGHRLKLIRRALGFSQAKMAKEFWVTPAAIAHWEQGKRKVPGPAMKWLKWYEEAAKAEVRRKGGPWEPYPFFFEAQKDLPGRR